MNKKIFERKQAIQLRKKGLSLSEICQQLSVAKSSVSVWCKNIVLSNEQTARLKAKKPKKKYGAIANHEKRVAEIKKIRHCAQSAYNKIRNNQLKRIKDVGTALYWAEGTKRNTKQIDFTNSDPEMIKLIIYWLKEIHKVKNNKLSAAIYYHV